MRVVVESSVWDVGAGDVLVLYVCVVCVRCMVVCRCVYRLRVRCVSIDIGYRVVCL